MKKIFCVAAKLVGIFALFSALPLLVQIGYSLDDFLRSGMEGGRILGYGLYFGVVCFFVYLLIFKTEAVAAFLRIEDGEIQGLPPYEQLLKLGIILVGLFLFTTRAPMLFAVLFASVKLPSILPWIVELLLAAILVFFPNRVIAIVNRKAQQTA